MANKENKHNISWHAVPTWISNSVLHNNTNTYYYLICKDYCMHDWKVAMSWKVIIIFLIFLEYGVNCQPACNSFMIFTELSVLLLFEKKSLYFAQYAYEWWQPYNGTLFSQFSCGQGGCGACTVNIRPWPKSSSETPAKYMAVNGCLRPLVAVHEMDVRDA